MDFQIDDSGPMTVVRVVGRLNVEVADELVNAVQDYARGKGATLAIDLSAVEMIDSSGLSALIGLVTRARLAEGRVLLVAPTPFVSSVFSVTNLDGWFEICANLDEAKQRLTS